MRRFWWVPIALLAFFLIARPRPAGHDGQPAAATTASRTAEVAQHDGAPDMQITPIATPVVHREQTPVVEQPTSALDKQPTQVATATLEPPVLVPEVAPPTPAREPTAPVQASQPVRLIIPQIGLDLAPVAVGLDQRRIPVVPRHDVGWYTEGASPGQGSNVIFWGHVLRWKDSPEIPAPFARVSELRPGAEIAIVTADGHEHRYRVTQQVQVRPDQVQYIQPTTSERVTLVSCIGDKVIMNGTLSKEFRLVTIAEPIA